VTRARIHLVVTALVAALGLVGASGALGEAERRGGTLVYASTADIISLDPPNVSDTISGAVVQMVYEGLVGFTSEMAVVPRLAESWTVSSDGLQWTFKLRRGVRFHDGTPMNAQAVKYTFDRILGVSGESVLRANLYLPYIKSVEAPDEQTVRFVLQFPDAFFLNRLAGNQACVVSPAAHRRYGKDLSRNPVGTGPFRFVHWMANREVVVERFDGYWGRKANLDRVVVRPVPEAGARVIALESGDVQLASRIPPEQVGRLERNATLKLSSQSTLRTLFVGMHAQKPPWSDRRVRLALSYAIDKEAIARSLYQGLAEVIPGPVPRGASGYAPIPGLAYDPDRAKRLLAEAGYPHGFEATLVTVKGRYLKDFELAQVIQQQLGEVGVQLKLDTVEWARYLDLLRMAPDKSPLQMWLDAWSTATAEAAGVIWPRFACSEFRPKGANTNGYCNPELDRIVHEAERTVNVPARDRLLRRAQEVLVQDAPSIFLIGTREVVGMSARLHDPIQMQNETLTVNERTWLDP
jgi:glutathione transport system substrate-binding protein